tara:strand:- start:1893 stop:2051 length:159 start_codon:yes stop_codon:yes gene_type:complete
MKIPLYTFEEYFSQSIEIPKKFYEKDRLLKHVMLSNQFSVELMESLFDIGDR